MAKSFYVSLSAFAAISFSIAANGSTIVQTTNDGGGKSSLTNWDASSTSPKGTPTQGNDYVSEKTLRSPSDKSSVSFGGNSLQLGVVGGSPCVFVPYGGTYTFNRDGLILAQGRFQPYGSKVTSTIAGTVTVTSPDSAPFEFWLSNVDKNNGDKTNTVYYLTAKLRGGTGTRMRICERAPASAGKFFLVPAKESDFAGTIEIGPKVSSEPYAIQCELQGSPSMPCTLWATQYATLTPQYGSTQWTIGALRLDAGSTMLTKLADGNTSTMTLTEGLTTAYPVNLTFPSKRTHGHAKDRRVWTVLTLPTDKGTIHPEHFVLATQGNLYPETLPFVGLSVTTNEQTSVASLVLTQRQMSFMNEYLDPDLRGYSFAKTGYNFYTATTNDAAWSAGAPASADIDYWTNYDLNMAAPDQCDENHAYVFPGASLTLSNQTYFCTAARKLTIPMLRMMPGSQFWPMTDEPNGVVEVNGKIHVLTSGTSDNVFMRIRSDSAVAVKSELSGTGRLQIQPNAVDTVNNGVTLDADNGKFKGKIRLSAHNNTVTDPANAQTLVLKAANNVGAPLDAFTADALEIRYFSTLEVTNDIVFATANRGLKVADARIKVGAGATFTFANDITYAGPLVKAGAGRLVLGGTALGTKKALTVSEGTLAVSKDAALDGVAVTFTGGALAVDPETTGEYGVKGPFSGSLPVAFDLPEDEETHEYSNVAVCTVADSADVTPKAVHIPRHRVVFHWRDNDDGTKTLLADISRTGAAIILR